MKKKNLFYVLIACIMSLLFALTGCNDNAGNNPNGGATEDTGTYYTVTFDSRGGSTVESQRIREGNPVVRPKTPTNSGYFLTGWFKQDNTEWNFDTDRVNSDITLYAGWQAEEQLPDSTESLTFVKEGNAYTVTGVGEETIVVIPAEHEGLPVTKIQGHDGTGAFAQKAFASVIIPDSITEIGQNIFYGCRQLAEVKLSANSNLARIGNNAFSACSSLTEITIPKGVTAIGDGAFNNCSVINFNVASENTVYRSENGHLIERATQTLIRGANKSAVPDGIKVLEVRSFQRVNGITELNIPKSVTKIGNYFINDCTITKINYAGTQAEWEQIDKTSMWNYGNRNVQVVFESAPVTPSEPVNLCEVYMTFGNETITAQLYDNATARDLVSRLPLTLSFSDFNSTEKIAYMPSGSSALNTSDAPETFTPAAGDMTVYIPWGNIAIFYNAFRVSSGLAPFGKIGSEGIAKLSQISNNTQITITKEKPEEPTDEQKILVAYFSCTNTTKGVAETIHSQLKDSVIYSITPAVPYTSADLNYSNSSCRANREQNDPTARPEITGSVQNIEQYDVIFIGYPIWWGQAPKIIYTFFESYNYDFNGVTIIPFCTSGSSGIGTSATNLHSLAPNANWKSGARISGNNVSALIAQMN